MKAGRMDEDLQRDQRRVQRRASMCHVQHQGKNYTPATTFLLIRLKANRTGAGL